MSTIPAASTTLSSGAIALQLLRGQKDSAPVGPKPSVAAGVPQADGVDRAFRLAARNSFNVAMDTLHMTYATSAKLALAMEAQAEAMARAEPQPLGQFAPEDAARLAAMGADAAIQSPVIRLDRAAFDDLVAANARETMMSVPGFAEAWAKGAVTVQRTEEVPEFGYVEKGFALFRDGNMIGGAGWGGMFNQAQYDKVAATGVNQAFGSVMGQGYYMTWGAAVA